MSSKTGSLTTTGQVALTDKQASRNMLSLQISGNYTGLGFAIKASDDGTNFYAVAAVLRTNRSWVNGTINPSDGATVGYDVPCRGSVSVEIDVTAITGGTVTAAMSDYNDANPPVPTPSNAGTFTSPTLASPTITGTMTLSGDTKKQTQVITGDGAITIKSGTVYLTKGSAAAITLAAPTASTDDGKSLRIVSTTAFAHTVTQTSPGFNNGSTASDVATFGAAVANNIDIEGYNGIWYKVGTPVGVTLG